MVKNAFKIKMKKNNTGSSVLFSFFAVIFKNLLLRFVFCCIADSPKIEISFITYFLN